jgi:hypothetical protein
MKREWDGFRAVVSTEGPLRVRSRRGGWLLSYSLADTADACYCAIEFSLREVQQGVLAGAGLFL